MNLITDPWIPIRTRSGVIRFMAPLDLTDPADPPIKLDAIRPDFNGALAQFLIGLLYTYLAPEDDAAWSEMLLSPPSRAQLEKALLPIAKHFELLSETGPAFMQDFDATLDGSGSTCELEALLIDAPGANTVENNAAHFVKPRPGCTVGLSTAAQMLLTLQINAPSGGAGHRTGLRGGGPLTTLLWPHHTKNLQPTTLFEKLWCNVQPPEKPQNLSSALPWCAPTLVSDGKPPVQALGNELWSFWATPRRIRLEPATAPGICELDPRLPTDVRVSGYRTRNYGANYPSERYNHPLSPYYYVKKDNTWLPLHPKSGGFGYRDWLALASGIQASQEQAVDAARRSAKVMSLSEERSEAMKEHFGAQRALWAFGFEMDNMKALGWHEALLPALLDLGPREVERVAMLARALIDAANAAADALGRALRRAWTPGGDGDTAAVRHTLFDRTETAFYRHMDSARVEEQTVAIKLLWRSELRIAVEHLFTEYAETAPPATDGRLERVQRTTEAYGALRRNFEIDVSRALAIQSQGKSSAKNKSTGKQKAGAV